MRGDGDAGGDVRVDDAAVARMRDVFGDASPVVYFIQRQPNGPVRIGHSRRLSHLFDAMLAAAPDPVLVRAVMPGGQPLEHWFHRRLAGRVLFGEWYTPAEPVLVDAEAFVAEQAHAFSEFGDLRAATVEALRRRAPELADIERLYRNGVPHRRIAEMAGLSESVTRARIEKMRALGFDLRHRRAPSSRSVRFDTAAGAGGLRARHVG